MKDRIDERNEKERIARSIVKYWNVNYVPAPKVKEPAAPAEMAGEPEGEAYEGAEDGRESAYNTTTGSYSGEYGINGVEDEVTKGQIEKILHEKTDAIRNLFEQNGEEPGNE